MHFRMIKTKEFVFYEYKERQGERRASLDGFKLLEYDWFHLYFDMSGVDIMWSHEEADGKIEASPRPGNNLNLPNTFSGAWKS